MNQSKTIDFSPIGEMQSIECVGGFTKRGGVKITEMSLTVPLDRISNHELNLNKVKVGLRGLKLDQIWKIIEYVWYPAIYNTVIGLYKGKLSQSRRIVSSVCITGWYLKLTDF
jgi:hypothetical protein